MDFNTAIYFGPSNLLGPGTLWRNSTGGYDLLFRLADVEKDSAALESIVITGRYSSCSSEIKSQWEFGGGLALESLASPLDADLKASLDRATATRIVISGWSIENLNLGQHWERSKSWDPAYREAMQREDSVLITAALRVSGFAAEYEFDSSAVAELKAKYPPGKTIALDAKLGGTGTINWSSQREGLVRVEAKGDFYVFGKPGHPLFGSGLAPTEGLPFTIRELRASSDAVLRDTR